MLWHLWHPVYSSFQKRTFLDNKFLLYLYNKEFCVFALFPSKITCDLSISFVGIIVVTKDLVLKVWGVGNLYSNILKHVTIDPHNWSDPDFKL